MYWLMLSHLLSLPCKWKKSARPKKNVQHSWRRSVFFVAGNADYLLMAIFSTPVYLQPKRMNKTVETKTDDIENMNIMNLYHLYIYVYISISVYIQLEYQKINYIIQFCQIPWHPIQPLLFSPNLSVFPPVFSGENLSPCRSRSNSETRSLNHDSSLRVGVGRGSTKAMSFGRASEMPEHKEQ